MSSEAWRRSRSERHLQTAAERRSGEGHKPTTFAESARRRRAERVENGDKRASKGASQVKSSSSGTTPEQEDVLEGMLNDYVAVADILEQSVAEANQARNGLTILLMYDPPIPMRTQSYVHPMSLCGGSPSSPPSAPAAFSHAIPVSPDLKLRHHDGERTDEQALYPYEPCSMLHLFARFTSSPIFVVRQLLGELYPDS
jgi:hypothetical protein